MPDERYMKEIASELKLIRKELQRKNRRDEKLIVYCAQCVADILEEKYCMVDQEGENG